MAQTKIRQTQLVNDGWVGAEETWTYASATTFTISGDKTDKYQRGDKVKLTQTTVKYFYIVAVTESGGTTTVAIRGGTDYTLANATITLPYYSHVENPMGFPHWFAYDGEGTGWSSTTIMQTRFNIKGNEVTVIWYIDGTSDSIEARVTLPVTAVASYIQMGTMTRVYDNSSAQNDPGYWIIDSSYSYILTRKKMSNTAFTASGRKIITGIATYQY